MSIDTVFKITLILKEITMSSEDQMVLENIDEFVNDEGKIAVSYTHLTLPTSYSV